MSRDDNGDGIIDVTHIIDALIVAGIVFFSVIGGDALLAFGTNDSILLTFDQIIRRLLTAGIAFGMVFLAQWARYRGIKLMISLPMSVDVEDSSEDAEKEK